MKKISIIIPYYNSHQYFLETLESIAIQSYPDIELIIVDDCSETASFQKLEEQLTQFQKKFEIKIIKHTENLGVAQARNTGLAHISGEYVLFLDADDLLAGLYSLEYRADFLESHPDFAGIAGYSIKIDENSQISKKQPANNAHFKTAVKNPTVLLREYCLDSLERSGQSIQVFFLLAGSCLLRSEVAKQFPFDKQFDSEDDIEWLIRFLTAKNKIQLHKLSFHFRREHAKQYHLQTTQLTSQRVLEKMKQLVTS